MRGIIIKAISGFYYVKSGDCIYECKARGKFRKDGEAPLVGDNVEFTQDGEKGVVNKIIERKNSLTRPPLANINKLFIVSSFKNPGVSTILIDRLISVAEIKGIEPIIVFNKSDSGDFSKYEKIYKDAGFRVFITSCVDNINVNELSKEVEGICAFTGNSGVGKSSILNILMPEAELKTGEVSEKLGRGRHTTRQVEIFKYNDGFLADTPGFSAMDISRYEVVYKYDLPYTFREFEDYLPMCRFTSCSHTTEKGCAVIEAVRNGKISESRHKSYVDLYNEVKDIKDWQKK